MKDKTDEMKNFGWRVDELIRERNITRSEFDKASGTTTQLRYDWRRRGGVPSAAIALKIARYFGVTVEYLLTGKDENPLNDTVKELQARIEKMKEFIKNA